MRDAPEGWGTGTSVEWLGLSTGSHRSRTGLFSTWESKEIWNKLR